MITIQHKAKQFELHLKFSTEWLHRAGRVIGRLLDFSEVRAIQKQKERMLREFGNEFLNIN